VPLPAPYVYRSALSRVAAGALDAVGDLLLGGNAVSVDWKKVERVAVLRLDHLGDLLHALPALRRLKRSLPQARLDLWVGPWGLELAGLFADVDQVHVAEADWFKRPGRVGWPWSQIWGLGRALKAKGYGAAFELRGDLRHHLALYRTGIPVRAGQALTAGRSLLTHPAVWHSHLHEQEQNLSLLDQAGVPAAGQGKTPYLRRDAVGEREAARVAASLKLRGRLVMIQAASGTAAKRWPAACWAAVMRGLPKGVTPVLLGAASELAEMQGIARLVKRPVAVASGRLSLRGLAAFLRRADLLLSVDSGPVHLAAVQGVSVLALYSGTNRAEQWAPRGPKVRVLRAAGFPCSPCELSTCPFENACMRAISPASVNSETRLLLKGKP